jgi:hypothetical protein
LTEKDDIVDQQVSIVLKSGERYDIHLAAAELAAFDKSSARAYIGEQFAAAGLETPNPMGKILLVDQILMLAQERKAADWVQPDPTLRKFLAAVSQSLARQAVTIDLGNYTL